MTKIRDALLLVVLGALAAYAVWQLLSPMLPYLLVALFFVLALTAITRKFFS